MRLSNSLKISDKFAGAQQVAWNYRTLGHGVSTGQSPSNLRVTITKMKVWEEKVYGLNRSWIIRKFGTACRLKSRRRMRIMKHEGFVHVLILPRYYPFRVHISVQSRLRKRHFSLSLSGKCSLNVHPSDSPSRVQRWVILGERSHKSERAEVIGKKRREYRAISFQSS